MSDIKIKIDSLYKIFGKNPKEALKHVKQGVGKDELLEKHNHVLGLSDINIDIVDKSIQVIMGLSGSGKSTLIRHINRLIVIIFTLLNKKERLFLAVYIFCLINKYT